MAEVQRFILPPGRIVSGSPSFKQEKDPQGRLKDKPSWFMGVAVPKTTPGINEINGLIYRVAAAGYQSNPAILQRIGLGLKGGFRWKFDDGDAPEDPKNLNNEGWAGCWIYKFSTSVGAMNCCDKNNVTIDPALIKTGFWVDVAASVSCNGNIDHTAGVYMNPDIVRFLGFGIEISNRPTAAQVFGSTPAQLPPGASATPLSPGGAPGTGLGAGQQSTGAPGFGTPTPPAGAPGFSAPPPPPAQQPAPPPPPETAEQIAARYRVTHYPGHRYNPATNAYDTDVPQPAAGLAVPAGASAFSGASSMSALNSPATASPSSGFPGATQHPGFANV